MPAAKRPRLPRTTKVLAGAVAAAVIAGGAWAAGTALHSSPSTVRFRAAASTNGGTSSGGSNGVPPAGGPHRSLGMGGGGTVASVDQAGNSFTISRPAPPNASGGAAPATPSTTSKTVKVTGSTTYYVTEPGSVSDIATGMGISAFGQVGSGGTITASVVNVVQSGIFKAPNKAPSGNAPASGTAPSTTNRPFAIGTVKSVTPGTGGSETVVVTSPRGDRTVIVNSSSTITKVVKGSFSDVKVGAMVFARGTRNSDGSLTASVVQIVASGVKRGPGLAPGFPFGRGFGRRGFAPGPGGAGGPGHWGPGPGGPQGSSSPAL